MTTSIRTAVPLLALTLAFSLVPWSGPAPAQTAPAPTPAEAATPAASAPPLTHRPLRSNQPPAVLPPTTPGPVTGPPGAPVVSVVPRQPHLALYPCGQCHKLMPVNTTPRQLLAAPHAAALQHGQGRMWCLDCHQGSNRDVLHGIGGQPIDFNSSSQLCAQCHSSRHRDWVFGAHGKRVANWQGDRQVYACTHCHDPHNPALAARAPSKPPPVRAGLSPMQTIPHERPAIWQSNAVPGVGHGPANKP